jgi:hypothetical protein
VSRLCPADASIERKSAHRFGQSTLRTSQAKAAIIYVSRAPELGAACDLLPVAGHSQWRASRRGLPHVERGADLPCLDPFGAQVMASHANSQFSEVCVDFIEFDGLATGVAANIKRFEELYPR